MKKLVTLKSSSLHDTNNLSDFIVYLIAILAPFSVTFLAKINVIIILILSSLLFYLNLISRKKIKFMKLEVNFLFSYISFLLISLFSLFYSITLITSPELPTNIFTRFITISTCILTIIIVSNWIAYQPVEKLILFLKFSLLSTVIFAVLSIYQILSFKYGLPFIETRSNVWGADQETKEQLGFRITSIAQEPNFYAPILIESILLSYLILPRKKFILFLMVNMFLVYKTYSTGVYIHLFTIYILFVFFFNTKPIKKIVTLMLILSPCLISLIILMTNNQYFITKLNVELSGESSRTQWYMTIISEIFNSENFFNLVFGHGLNTLSYFNELSILTSSNLYFSISNNFYIDILWDSGILGFVFFIFGMTLMAKRLLSIKNKNDYGFIALLLFFSFLITSLYRSEYTSTHFIWVVLNILVCYAITIKKGNYQCD